MDSPDGLQDILAELHITSLDESDLEHGLHDLNSDDFASTASFAATEEDTSNESTTSLQVRQALDAVAGGSATPLEGADTAALEAQLRLQLGPLSAPGLLRASPINRLSAVDARLQQLARVVAPLQDVAARIVHDSPAPEERRAARRAPSRDAEDLPRAEGPTIGGLPTARTLRLRIEDLTISEAFYQMLCSRGDDQLNVREWMQVRFYEARSSLKADSERLRLEVEALRENNYSAETRAQRAERALQVREAAVADLKQELEQLQRQSCAQLEEVTGNLRACQRKVGENADKAQCFDDVAREAERLREEAKTLHESMSSQNATLQLLQKEHADAMDRLQQVEGDLRFTRTDAEANDRRARLLEETLARRDSEAAELRAKVESLREKKRELARKATEEQSRGTNEVRDKVDAEIRRLREQAQSDLEAVRTNLNCLHEKEVLMLEDRMQVSEAKAGELQRRLEEEEQAHQSLQLSGARVRAQLQGEITELSGALKLRAFEAERAVMTHEEVSSLRSKLQVENEQLRQQVDVLRKEYYSLEVQHREGRACERAELASLREQLRGYMEVEKELDAAIRAAADGLPGGGGGGGEAGAQAHSIDEALLIGTTLASAPTSAQRRIQQSLLLAQEVQRQKRQAVQLQVKLGEAETEAQRLSEELEAARTVHRSSSEPQAYLLESLRRRESEAIALRRDLTIREKDLEQCRRHLESAVAARVQVEEDLKKLLAQRQHLEGLRVVLTTTEVHSSGVIEAARAEHRGRAPCQPAQAARPGPVSADGEEGGGGPAWYQRLRGKLAHAEDGSE